MFTAADTPLPPPVEALESLFLAHVEARDPVEAQSVEARAPVEAQSVEGLAVEALAGPGAAPGGQGVAAPGDGGHLLRPLDHLLQGALVRDVGGAPGEGGDRLLPQGGRVTQVIILGG